MYSQGLIFRERIIGDGFEVKGLGTCTDAVIRIPPTTPEGEPVTSIGQCAFYNRTHITSVEIPEGVNRIEVYGFMRCTSLTSVTLPESLEQMYHSAFCQCTSLVSIRFPKSI